MSNVDFDALKKYMEIPPAAESLLSKPERETTFNLNLKINADRILRAETYVVLYNTARGPAKGGIRMKADVTLAETRDLAERMAWKTALARIPFGGGKSGIAIDPKSLTRFEKTAMIKAYVHQIILVLTRGLYVPAPDMGTNATDMAAVFGELHIPECVTGKPTRAGGLAGRLEATGLGTSHAALLTLEKVLKKKPGQATAAVQGFGNVGSYAALFLHEAGVRVIAATDHASGRFNKEGLDIPSLIEHKKQTGSLEGAQGEPISNDELLTLDVDLLLPCAQENQITRDNARDVRAAAVIEGANGPTTPEADVILDERHIPVVPDILANAGGVIASYVEWRQGKSGIIVERDETFATVKNRIQVAFDDMLAIAGDKDIPFRTACRLSAAKELVASLRDRDWI